MIGTVLIVDDDASDRKHVRRLLGRIDPAIQTVELAGLELLPEAGPDPEAVFLDYLLPGSTGLSMLDRLRQRWPQAAVFLMTGHGDEEVAKSAIQHGAIDYISKEQLGENAVRRMLESGVEQARMRWKLAEQQSELLTFSEVLVHDLKAPIRAVGFLAEQIRDGLRDGHLEEVDGDLSMLDRAAGQMAALIDSLAEHIRLDRDATRRRVLLPELVQMAETALHHEIARSGATLGVDLDGIGDGAVKGSPPQLAQVLQNLIGNAIKFAGPCPPQVRIRAWAEDDTLIVSVADRGIGVPDEHRHRIFEPFRRLADADGPPGTGLGLATCRKIVERHGGRIWCQPRAEHPAGAGTDFRFALPLDIAQVGERDIARAG